MWVCLVVVFFFLVVAVVLMIEVDMAFKWELGHSNQGFFHH
jgi:hypothetical protein